MHKLTIILFFAISVLAKEKLKVDTGACEVNSDCVAASCCDNSQAVNKKFAPDCRDMMCTADCKPPYDCGCSEILCIEKKCTVKIKDSMKTNSLCVKK